MRLSTPHAYLAAALASAVGLATMAPAAAQPGDTNSRPPMARLAMSALGDLSPYRTIAVDTLVLVDKGEIPAARLRVKDLETAWDKSEATLKPKDKAIWTSIDGLIDAALTDLRSPNPQPATCAASLKALIAKVEAIDRA